MTGDKERDGGNQGERERDYHIKGGGHRIQDLR